MTGERSQRPADHAQAHPDEARASIGSARERAADAIPGGVQPGDERMAANATRDTGSGRQDEPAGRRDASGVPGELV